MKFKFPLRSEQPESLLKQCGYALWQGKSGPSYVHRLGSTHYPRFHAYLVTGDNYFEVDLHLDQKQPSYGGTSAHSGEYEGVAVENEAQRITAQIAKIYGM